MVVTNAEKITIQGAEFKIADIDRMEVVASEIDNNTVNIDFNDRTANVSVAGNIAAYITASITGANVTITQSELVGDAIGEITYVLKGNSDNGAFTLKGSYKSTIELHGLTLTNPYGAAIDIENSKRIELSSKNETVNTLADGTGGEQKAALYCKGHLELKGKGTLNVIGNTSHAIAAKEYIEMKNCTVNILGSAKDGINCTQYFLMESGTLNITNPGDDGIQVSYKDDTDRKNEDTGNITITGGAVTIDNITAAACKALKADGDFIMTNGSITAYTVAPGLWDNTKLQTKASACINADGNIDISGGTLNLCASGGGGSGISANGSFRFNKADLTILTSGGVLAYVSGSIDQNYTGNTDNLASNYKSSPKGMKIDGDVIINGGNIDVTTSGNGGEGIESKSTLTINNGNIKVRAKDDAINSSSHMYIKGGIIDVISTGNDGLDSNGDLWIEGGIVMAFGSSAPECGIDANHEDGYTVYFTGGYILAAGGGNSVPGNANSTQPYVSVNATVNASTTVSISNGQETLYTFTTPDDLTSVNLGGSNGNRPGAGGPGGGMGNSSSSVLISVPGMTTGTSYTIASGNNTTTGNAVLYSSSSRPGGK